MGQHDQLEVIFDIIGTPSEEDVGQLPTEDAKTYLREFEKRQGEGISTRLNFVDADGLELLSQMLLFNPRKRCDVDSALAHKSLQQVKDNIPTHEEGHNWKPASVDLYFEKEGDHGELGENKLRKYFDDEIKRFHSM